MRVKVLKAWTIEGITYTRIGEILEVENNYAVKGIRAGLCEDVEGKIIRIEPEEKKTKFKKGTK